MRGTQRLLTAGVVVLSVLAGGLAFAGAQAFAAAPEVGAESVSSLTPFEARVEAIVNAGEEPTECHFQYGKTTVSEHTIPCEQGTPPGTLEGGEQGVGVTVTGLAAGTPYVYRVIVKNATSEAKGAEETFTTLTAEAPAIVGESVASATASDPQVEAVINPNYQQTTYSLQYATSEEALINEEGVTVKGAPPAMPLPAVLAELPVGPIGLGPVRPQASPYYYRVVATNATGSSDGPPQSFLALGPPVVTTGGAQGITRSTATLSGTVTPEGVETTYHFAYIDQAGYEKALAGSAQEKANPYAEGETTAPLRAGASYEPQAVGPLLAGGMLPETTYDYALVAKNEVGVTVGPNQVLTTSYRTPPVVSTGGASAISQNAATITGIVATNGLQTNYGFEITTEPGNNAPATGLGSIGGAATDPVSLTLTELQPGTTYYYRVTATNADGTRQGEPETFTTPGFSNLLVAPASLPQIANPAGVFPAGSQENTGTGTATKALTNAEKLKKSLKACRKEESKSKRAKCEKKAEKKYRSSKKQKSARTVA